MPVGASGDFGGQERGIAEPRMPQRGTGAKLAKSRLLASLQCAGQLLVKPPHRHIVLRVVSLQLFILWPLDRSDGLLLRGAAGDRLLDTVADIDQHLAKAGETLLRLPG